MTEHTTQLSKRIDSARPLILAEMAPPKGADPTPVRERAKRFAGKVHALGVSDNRDGAGMSALAAASLVAAEGVEPILHVVTRDRNRIALVSHCLGAGALGVRNLLCTSGTHQTLGNFRAAKNVYDIDSVQLLGTVARLATDGAIVGERAFDVAGSYCLGAVAAPFTDPAELHLMRLAKKVEAGARFLITQPVFDTGRFETWWKDVTERGIPEQAAVVAGIRPLLNAGNAKAYAGHRPLPMVPDAVLERVTSPADGGAQRDAGIAVALETIERLLALGVRGFEIRTDGDDDAALEIIEKSGLEIG